MNETSNSIWISSESSKEEIKLFFGEFLQTFPAVGTLSRFDPLTRLPPILYY